LDQPADAPVFWGRAATPLEEERIIMRFSGKVALVTGGSSGIGRAAAMAFAREGALVVLSARGEQRGLETAREITKAGGVATFVRADISKSGDIQALITQTVELYGRLDCAFNNAATNEGGIGSIVEFTEEQFDRVIGVNLKSVWLCMKYEIQQMLGQTAPGGAIVNTSSVNGLGGSPVGALYSAAKAGVLALTKSAAQEFAARGIRVNALVAGAFRTPMLDAAMDVVAGGDEEKRKAVESRYLEFVPQRRIGDPAEAAEAALWLCSDAASYVTGHSMIVDGGMTAWAR
jgi:NAD(P)-dependent dehydrogenase (short-subunit alcohol dehydrogenase family)